MALAQQLPDINQCGAKTATFQTKPSLECDNRAIAMESLKHSTCRR